MLTTIKGEIKKKSKKKKGEINIKTIIVGDFNTPLTPMDISSRQKINKEMQALNDTLNKIDVIDIYGHSI